MEDILGMSYTTAAVMFAAIFLACVIVVWYPYIVANQKREQDGKDKESFFKPYLYLFIANAIAVVVFMTAVSGTISDWGFDHYLTDPSAGSLTVVFFLSFIATIVMQDKIKVLIDSYQKKLQAGGLWDAIVSVKEE